MAPGKDQHGGGGKIENGCAIERKEAWPKEQLPQPDDAPHRPAEIVKTIHAPRVAACLVEIEGETPIAKFIAKAWLVNKENPRGKRRHKNGEIMQPMRKAR